MYMKYCGLYAFEYYVSRCIKYMYSHYQYKYIEMYKKFIQNKCIYIFFFAPPPHIMQYKIEFQGTRTGK